MAKTRKVSKGLSTVGIANTMPNSGQSVIYDGAQYTVGYGNYLLGRSFTVSNLAAGQTMVYNGTVWTNRYLKGLTITAVAITNKSAANIGGGDAVTVTGIGFLSVPRLYINQTALTSVVVVNSTTITGVLPGVPTPGVYSLFLSNGDGECTVLTNAVTYVAAPVIVNPANLGSFPNNVSLSIQFTMDVAPTYIFTVIAGTIPAGLALSLGGVLTGSPNSTSIYNFTLLATDYRGQTASKAFTMTVV
jgi:hypothetical protein